MVIIKFVKFIYIFCVNKELNKVLSIEIVLNNFYRFLA